MTKTELPSARGAALLLTIALAIPASCRPKPTSGSPCRAAEEPLCTSSDRAFACHAGAWVEISCKGPGGCARRGDADECDDTVAALGDPCPRNPPIDFACTKDGRQALVCKDGQFGLWRDCRGKEGCAIVGGGHLSCDTTLGQKGDPCAKRGTYSCGTTGDEMLICDGQALAPASSCRGPLGCHFDRENRKIDCDDAIAREGDPCDRPSRITCDADGKSELVCAAAETTTPHLYTKKRECRRTPCRIEGSDLFCD